MWRNPKNRNAFDDAETLTSHRLSLPAIFFKIFCGTRSKFWTRLKMVTTLSCCFGSKSRMNFATGHPYRSVLLNMMGNPIPQPSPLDFRSTADGLPPLSEVPVASRPPRFTPPRETGPGLALPSLGPAVVPLRARRFTSAMSPFMRWFTICCAVRRSAFSSELSRGRPPLPARSGACASSGSTGIPTDFSLSAIASLKNWDLGVPLRAESIFAMKSGSTQQPIIFRSGARWLATPGV